MYLLKGWNNEGRNTPQWINEILIAARFGWTPQQIADMPASYVDELMAFMNAEAEVKKDG